MKSCAFAYFISALCVHAYNSPVLSFNIPTMMYIVRILSLMIVYPTFRMADRDLNIRYGNASNICNVKNPQTYNHSKPRLIPLLYHTRGGR